MGTSTNQGSPGTSNWRAAQLAYANEAIPVDRALQEIWRAATHQEEGNIAEGLSSPIIAHCLEIVAAARTRDDAINRASVAIALSNQASLATAIAQRAVALSFAEGRDPIDSYASSLFAEATNYLVSRDLPGFVGHAGRAKNVTQALAFKTDVRQRTTEIVAALGRIRPDAPTGEWREYVRRVVERFRTLTVRDE